MVCKQLRLAVMHNTYAGKYACCLGTSDSLWGQDLVFGDQMPFMSPMVYYTYKHGMIV